LAYRSGDFPVSERFADTILSLPMHPHLTDHEVSTVANTVVMALQKQ
jgi:dTDP-4-amino-4,6-dideoxygalactose transaminase